MRVSPIVAAILAALMLLLLPALGWAEGSGHELAHAGEDHGGHGASFGSQLPLWSMAPFAILLLCIAILPLAAEHWWEHNKNKGIVVAALSIPFIGYLFASFPDHVGHALSHAAMEFVSFIALLGALFTISGGILIKGSFAGSPLFNTLVMAGGAVFANLAGTTGASMVLIRPLLRANDTRQSRVHIAVFFIFIVSNTGGLLTPLGDPPLFLGFLSGVPFEWTLQLAPQWAFVVGTLLTLFFAVDTYKVNAEKKAGHNPLALSGDGKFGVEGLHNFALLLGIVVVVIGKGQGWGFADGNWPFGIQEGLMIALGLISYFTTKKHIHEGNAFGFGPIIEVAVLFTGIFITMIAPLQYLNANSASLGVEQPWQFFWAAGTLSSFLDNAPTYLAFAAAAAGQLGIATEGKYLADLLAQGETANSLLVAIACGSVFMGANTYIGNGPNFMVKAIADSNGVKMPSFFGYMAWSVGILVPIFIAVTFIFMR